jgi:hypothetical protein
MLHVRMACVSLSAVLLPVIAQPTMADPIHVTGTPPEGAAGERYYWAPVTTGGNKATMQFAYLNPPSWSGEFRSSGAIIGTPTRPGTYSNIVIEAWDGVNFGLSAPLTITIAGSGSSTSPAQPKLTISGTPETSVEVGKYYGFRPTVVGPPGVSLSYAIQNKPSWAQFSASTGMLSGTAAAPGESGGIVLTVSDGTEHAALAPFSITVDPPAASPSGTVELSWSAPSENTDGTALTNLTGYVVRYGTSSSALNSQLAVKSTNVQIDNLSRGTWYFEVASVNSKNVESQFSPSLSETVQ